LNGTLKTICAMLRDEDTQIRRSAAVVLARIRPREPGAIKAIGETLAGTSDPEIAEALLAALRRAPHDSAVKYLLQAVTNETLDRHAVLETLGNTGPRAVMTLKRLYPKLDPSVHQVVAEVLPRIRTEPALGFLCELFYHEDHEVVRAAVHALREEIDNFNKKQRNDLVRRLRSMLEERRTRRSPTALSAVLISLGIVGENRCKKPLLPYVSRDHDAGVRRHALMSLARLPYKGETHGDVVRALLPILDEEDPQLVHHAVEVLQQIKPRRKDAETLRKLVESPHGEVQAYAVRALGQLDTVGHARLIRQFLGHQDRNLRDAAREALSHMSNAAQVLVEEIEEIEDPAAAADLVDILGDHRKRVGQEATRRMAQRLFELVAASDPRAQVYRNALLAVQREGFRRSVLARANAARKAKDHHRERDCLALLEGTAHITPEIRMRLAVVRIKSSRKDMDRSQRMRDPALEEVSRLLMDGGKEFARAFLAEPALGPEDYLYVGIHFSERINEERRFGADVLRHVTRKWPRTKGAKAATKQLKKEGI